MGNPQSPGAVPPAAPSAADRSRSQAFRGSDAGAMAHFYRGEMQRLTVWRTRMDVTTNWAIIATIGLLSISFKHPSADAIFIVNIATLWFLLVVEARRYRFYDVWRWRMRILEAHFLAPILTGRDPHLEGPWREDLTADLLYPTFKITMREAMGRRLLRNFTYLFLLVLVAAMAHVLGISRAIADWQVVTQEQILRSLHENSLLLWIIVATYVPLLGLGIVGWRRRKVAVELHDPSRRKPYRV